MTLTALLLGLSLKSQAAERPTIQYYQQQFEIHTRKGATHVPLTLDKPKTPDSVAFRKNDAFAVWDERGLTLRRGDDVQSTKLPEISVSPRVFSHEEILKTIHRIHAGECTKDATAVSGAKRMGSMTYFLLRWEDTKGKPWAEALVEVDMSAGKLRPRLIGRFEGLSTALKPIDDKLQIVHDRLGIISQTADSWGLSTYDPATKQFSRQAMGGILQSYEALNPIQGLFVEKSGYGTTIAGRVDLETGTRKILYEGRWHAHFLDNAHPEIVLASNEKKTKLVNCVTGSVRLIPYPVAARRVEKDVLLWSPADEPAAVWLMTPAVWETQATWRAKKP